MYSQRPSFVYGFHGTDETIAREIVNQQRELKPSQNAYDWLGEGVYFWENNLERAQQYAIEDSQRKATRIQKPSSIGAVIDLGNCFDLLDQKYLDFLKLAYDNYAKTLEKEGGKLPGNTTFGNSDFDFRKRELDCAVIRWAHGLAKEGNIQFDTVRAAFWEGEPLYPGAGFRSKNHIQIAVLNPDCIKGVFFPRSPISST